MRYYWDLVVVFSDFFIAKFLCMPYNLAVNLRMMNTILLNKIAFIFEINLFEIGAPFSFSVVKKSINLR